MHQNHLSAKHTTNELILAQTLLEALEKKVGDVEDLLESLQDEVWAAEEKAEQEDGGGSERETNNKNSSHNNNNTNDQQQLSLLDQILAMVLGALPMEPDSNNDKDRHQKHFRYIKEEHEFIVNGWKEHFGRLPPAFVPSGTTGNDANDDDDADSAATDAEHNDNDDGSEPKSSAAVYTASGPSLPAGTVKLSKITSRTSSNSKIVAPPPSGANTTTTTTTPEEQRIALGIVDNESGEWDDDDDNDNDDEHN